MDGAGREGPGVVVAADNEELGANFGLFQCPQEGLDPDNGQRLGVGGIGAPAAWAPRQLPTWTDRVGLRDPEECCSGEAATDVLCYLRQVTVSLWAAASTPDTPGSPEGNTEGPGTASSEPLLPS